MQSSKQSRNVVCMYVEGAACVGRRSPMTRSRRNSRTGNNTENANNSWTATRRKAFLLQSPRRSALIRDM